MAKPEDLPPRLATARFPEPVLRVLRTLDGAGYRSWLVGGAVRDLLLDRPRTATDHDVATPARPETVVALFPRVIETGIEHGTVTVLANGIAVEVTTFRGEGAYLDGRRPSSVTFLDDVDADLARRDFTVNALAYDPLGLAFRDPYGGRADVAARVIRAVGDPLARFREDGLRPLRAARFAAQLGFEVEPATRDAIPAVLDVVAKVSVERIMEELSRLVVADEPRRGLDLLEATGLLGAVLPEVAAAAPAARAHAFATATAAPAELPVRLAALLHVAAPPSAATARGVLQRLRFSNAVIEDAAALAGGLRCAGSGEARAPLPSSDAEVRRWLARATRARAGALLALTRADARAAGDAQPGAVAEVEAFAARVAAVERERPPLTAGELALDGRAIMERLGIPPGRAVGEALRHALERVLEEPSLNTPEELTSLLGTWWARRASGG
ncbi:MAG: CCA tRNA nucleotidyltransferase [Anaeromyxobacteraceae bacterium]